MSVRDDWTVKVSGQSCPFDLPRAGISKQMFEVSKLSASTLYLEKIQTYRGHCVLVFDPRHVTRIDELSPDEWQRLSQDIVTAEKAVYRAMLPDHINVASIGQVVAHLHWHIIPRYIEDQRWGGPIWTTSPDEMIKDYLDESEYEQLAIAIRNELS